MSRKYRIVGGPQGIVTRIFDPEGKEMKFITRAEFTVDANGPAELRLTTLDWEIDYEVEEEYVEVVKVPG